MSFRKGVYTFSSFGKARKSVQTIDSIMKAFSEVQAFKANLNEDDLWGEVCRKLGISSRRINKRRLRQAYRQQKKSKADERSVIAENICGSPPVCGAQAEQNAESIFEGTSEEDSGAQAEQNAESIFEGTSEEDSDVYAKGSNSDHCKADNQISDTSESSPGKKTADQFFSHPLPNKPCFFFIPRDEWEELRISQHKNRFTTLNWTNVIAKGIRSLHPFCSFGFKRHTVKVIGSERSGPLFSCNGYCRFADCTVTVSAVVKDEKSLRAKVLFCGKVWHSLEETKRRPVRAAEREAVAQVLRTKLPRSLYVDNLSKLEESILESGCRDQAPTPGTLRTLSCLDKRKNRRHENDFLSLNAMFKEERTSEDATIQKIIMQPKGLMLWSTKSLDLFWDRCKKDIVYLDATGSVIQKQQDEGAPFYIYKMVVRHPIKGCSPIPVATYVTCDHTTASVSFFLGSLSTAIARAKGIKMKTTPVMFMCDSSIVLLQSISYNFCGQTLTELLEKYYKIVTNDADKDYDKIPILHRCLSHIMKNAKGLCRKHTPKHYRLAMYTFGALTQASTMEELDNILQSAHVVFSSPCSGKKFPKHLRNLKMAISQGSITHDIEVLSDAEEDLQNEIGSTSFQSHFHQLLERVELDMDGEPNCYFSPSFMTAMTKYMLPQAALWTGLLLGDLGRHGSGPVYQMFTQKFCKAAGKTTQNYSQDNQTQGIMEKSQWDLKRIRFERRRITRLDDFAETYKHTMKGLLREFKDSFRRKRKRHHVDEEKWKARRQTKRGLYVSPLTKHFVHRAKRTVDPPQEATTSSEKCTLDVTLPGKGADVINEGSQLPALWAKNDTEVVVSVVPSQTRGQNIIIHHSELNSLRPHQWLTGEIIESYIHILVNKFKLESKMYVLNHYTAGVILFGKREEVRRHSLSKIDFDNYRAIVSFVNISNVHWKFLYVDAAQSTVYLVDPARSTTELKDSEQAARKLSEYFKMRWNTLSRTDWVDKKWKGAVMDHPVQTDSSSCGVCVIMMSKRVMEEYPAIPKINFKTSQNQMSKERTTIAEDILHASVFETENNCAMCATSKPPGAGPSITDWIQCDTCHRWFHTQCLAMTPRSFHVAECSDWNCCLCK